MENLLGQAGVQKTVFLQSFRRQTGTTPRQYILQLRLEYARDLMMETELPIGEIAERAGFSDPFYFSRCFRKHFGIVPSVYRQSCL